MARRVAFVGPALPAAALSSHAVSPKIELRPPARRGDVLAAVEAGATVIGLIDGLVIGNLAVTPRELRDSHARGARIIGGASLGALRAVECPDSVEGVGEVYTAFRNGILRDDDEVVGTFDDQYRQIAYPLVIVRDRCRESVAAGVLPPEDAELVIARIKALPFVQRTRHGIRHALRDMPSRLAEVIDQALHATTDDIKARDARLVFEAMLRP